MLKSLVFHVACFGFILLNGLQGLGQDTIEAVGQNFSVRSKFHYGFIIPHRAGMARLIKHRIPALEIAYERQMYGKKPWERAFNYPSWGVGFYYADLGNPKEMGVVSGVYPYYRFYLLRRNWINFNYRVGSGICYITRKWERQENYKNTAIGSNINILVSMQLEAQFTIKKRLTTAIGISFTHYSNAAFQMPNLGFNVPAINVGVGYNFGKPAKEFNRDSIPKLNYKNEISAFGAFGVNEIYPALGKKYGTISFSIGYARVFNRKHRLHLLADVFYDGALIGRLANDAEVQANHALIIQPGLSLLYEITISRLSILVGMGAYIYNRWSGNSAVYNRIGTRFQATDKLFINFTLKTHLVKAVHAELGIGYKLWRK